jgi:hypothetical protein
MDFILSLDFLFQGDELDSYMLYIKHITAQYFHVIHNADITFIFTTKTRLEY